MQAESAPEAKPAGLIARLREMLTGSHEASLTKRLAGTVFIIRVLSAGLAYFSQVLLARWMGGSDYGIYVYVWTWVLLLGSMMDFGIAVSRAEISPNIAPSGQLTLLRGFLSGSRWMTFAASTAMRCCSRGPVTSAPWIDRTRCSALHRLPHPARLRGRQHAGRPRPLI